jgi:hypothetical protein
MTDWTEPERLLEHVQEVAAKETQLKLIDTEHKKRLSEREKRYLQTIEEIKAWQEKEKAEREASNNDE